MTQLEALNPFLSAILAEKIECSKVGVKDKLGNIPDMVLKRLVLVKVD